jgi:pyruvate formate lyase activating enzyme
MNVGLQKTSLVNFPGRVAAAVFLPGCNLRCPYCHNGELATASVVSGPRSEGSDGASYASLDEVHAHLEKRKRVLGGLAISGGEPLLSAAMPGLVKKARELELSVKIDTNGTLPDRLRAILDDPETRPDMIAVDVKTSPSRYGELTVESAAGERAGTELLRSIAILAAETNGSSRPRRVEYRTVLVPGLVGENELREIGAILPPGADWELAAFVPGLCLDSSWNDRAPYGPEETKRLIAIAKSVVPGARLR